MTSHVTRLGYLIRTSLNATGSGKRANEKESVSTAYTTSLIPALNLVALCYALSLCRSLQHMLLLLFCVLLWSTPPAAALLDDNYVICLAPFQWKSFAVVGRIGKRIITVFSPLQQVWLLPNYIHIHVQSTYLCMWVNAITQAKPRKRAQNKDSDYVNVDVH